MRGLPKLWASDYLQTSGAKVGEPTKVRPDALAEQGEQPGPSGQQMGAEHLNELLHVLTDHVAQTRYAGLFQWRSLGGALDDIRTAVWDPGSGRTFASTDTDDLVTFSETRLLSNTGSSGSFRASCVRKMAGGLASVALFRQLGGDALATYTIGPSTTAFETLGGSYGHPTCAAYDAVGGVAICYYPTGGIVRLLDGGSPATLVPASSFPSVPTQQTSAIASGAGRTLLTIGSSSDEIVTVTSDDGGDTWTQRDSIPADAGSRVLGAWYVPDFLNLGPRFVTAATAPSVDGGALSVWHSSDGTAWESASIPAWLQNYSTGGGAAVLLGDTLILSRGSSPLIAVLDLRTQKGFFVQPHGYDVTRMWLDGIRLHCTGDNGGTHKHFMSGPLQAPLSTLLEVLNR